MFNVGYQLSFNQMVHSTIWLEERQRGYIEPSPHHPHPSAAPDPGLWSVGMSTRASTRTAATAATTAAAEAHCDGSTAGQQPLKLRRWLRDPLVIRIIEGVRVLPAILGIDTRMCNVESPIRPEYGRCK